MTPARPGRLWRSPSMPGCRRWPCSPWAIYTGAAVVLDATSGEILAMASSPSFDPSLFDKGVPAATWTEWMTDPKHPLLNKATAGLFAPGSTFKPTVALAALKCGALTEDTLLTCPGFLKLGDHIFWCDNHDAHGTITVTSALQVSCDVFFYQVAMMTGIDRMAEMAYQLGIGTDLGVDLPNATPGLVPTHAWARQHGIHWVEGSTVVQGIGQGYTQATPLALATMIARVATGMAVGPHITRRVGGQLQSGSQANAWAPLDIDDRHLAVVRQGLFEVVNTPKGTAYDARLTLPNVQMAGKTGTAQVHNASAAEKARNFNELTLPWADRPNALFVAFAPYDNPRYAAAVVVEHGNWGGMAAAPIARDLLTYAITHDPGRAGHAACGADQPDCGTPGMNADSIALHRPFRDRSFGLVRKFLRINWLFVLCVCLLAGVGYAALYSAAGGSPQPYANSQLYRFLSALAADAGDCHGGYPRHRENLLGGLCARRGAAAGR